MGMINIQVPKTPAATWRELDRSEKAYKVGQALRILWELTKPVLAWTLFILVLGAWSIFTVLIRSLTPGK